MSNTLLYQEFRHYWSYCNHCEINVVICGVCGNNSCNGGYGKIKGETCVACPSAYKMQSDESPNNIIASKYEKLEVDTGFK